ncbi:4Fe-4S binding protein [Geomonas sp. Red69]|uniref:4Fe-4S binding protein n=1 Tax=Geomonas diazotrophica TaxID=2843197 RepID=A0ABX8JFQ8_9BACT|nr:MULTISPECIES: mercury methylation ferredoxin HgcB [Geomonas]MBU5638925.1 4Fe-4S binding protein [Geomonas diazotrophica]QWV96404.1 4Fe-4S binding protein [Geomonas nitrogeniifigens]QXE85471.1 4Fe-4S binding protein [Geomonas nitrogeniifigens]
MKGFRYLQGVATLELSTPLCIGCGRCVEVCPHQVFRMEGKRAVMVDRDACMECGACALNCPAAALKVDAGVGCASGMIHEWLRERKIPGFGGGGCCG